MTDNIDSLKMRIIERITAMTSMGELAEIEQHIKLNALCYEALQMSEDEEIIEEEMTLKPVLFNKILDDLERIELVRT